LADVELAMTRTRTRLDVSSEIDLTSRKAAKAWAERLGTSVEELRAVVAEVGPRPAAVGAALGVPLKIPPARAP
jgi:hypothetical protein